MQHNGYSYNIMQHNSSNCNAVHGTMAMAMMLSGMAPECDSCDWNHNNKDLKPSLTALETNANFTKHLAMHISVMQCHLTSAPKPSKLPYAPSFDPPTGY